MKINWKRRIKLKLTWKSEFGNQSGFWMDSTVELTWNQEWILDGFGIGIDVEPALELLGSKFGVEIEFEMKFNSK